MKHCSKFCCGFWPFIVVPLLVLLLAIVFAWRDIETDVASNANEALSDAKLDWALVDTHSHGREVQLSGEAPYKSDKEAAISDAESAFGVRTVTWLGTIAPSPASLSINKVGDAVTLTGASGSTIAEQLMPLINAQEYNATDEFEGLNELDALLKFVSSSADGYLVVVQGNSLTLTGTLDAFGKTKLYEQAFNDLFDGEVISKLKVELPSVSAESLVSTSECQSLFNELTSSESIRFQSAKAAVLPESFGLLDEFTLLSLRCPAARFDIVGHTDNTGDPTFNRTLSLERAKQVVLHIVNSGVEASRFNAIGLGDTSPIADNSTALGRAKNRRVEFKVFDVSPLENGNK